MIGADSRFTALTRDSRGSVLPMAAMGMILTAALVGGGIDMSRAYRVQNRLQSACDSGVLAGRRAVSSTGFDDAAEEQAKNYFRTNFDDRSQETTGTVFTPTTDDNGQTIKGEAATRLNLAVMKIFGFKPFHLAVSCQASMGVGNSDVMMVLDTTGSMDYALGSGKRITALRTAMKNFYTTVKNATTGTNARIRYGFVPFSSSVNVGRLLLDEDPSYINDTWTIQSRLAVQDGPIETENSSIRNSSKTTYGDRYSSSRACENALPNNTPWTNNGAESNLGTTDSNPGRNGDQRWTTTVSQPQQRTVYECYQSGNWHRTRYYTERKDFDTNTNWRWSYQPVTYDVSAYKTFSRVSTSIGNYGGSVSSTWAGCIEERSTVANSTFSYSTTTGMSPAAATDLDLDTAPTDDPLTKWSPMWPQAAYMRYSNASPTTTGYKVGSYCPHKAQLLAEMTQGEFGAYADALYPEGATYLDIGMAWGGRLLSPTGIFQENVNIEPTNGGEVSRHLIFMSDGELAPNNDIQTSWGVEYHDRRVTSNGSSNHKSRHTSRFLALCEAIKAKGIRIWTISFTTGVSSDLQTCASADSALNANDASELDEAFQEIAKQVGELRLIQ